MNRRDFLQLSAALPVAAYLPNLPIVNEQVVKFSAPLLQVDVPNKNNRIYPKEVVSKAIEALGDGQLLGGFGFDGGAKVMFSEVSHSVSNFCMEDGWMCGEVEILNTPAGKLLKSILNDSVDVAFRTAGVGEIFEGVVQDGFKFTSVSVVSKDEAS
jgi:hypothetical protein